MMTKLLSQFALFGFAVSVNTFDGGQRIKLTREGSPDRIITYYWGDEEWAMAEAIDHVNKYRQREDDPRIQHEGVSTHA